MDKLDITACIVTYENDPEMVSQAIDSFLISIKCLFTCSG